MVARRRWCVFVLFTFRLHTAQRPPSLRTLQSLQHVLRQPLCVLVNEVLCLVLVDHASHVVPPVFVLVLASRLVLVVTWVSTERLPVVLIPEQVHVIVVWDNVINDQVPLGSQGKVLSAFVNASMSQAQDAKRILTQPRCSSITPPTVTVGCGVVVLKWYRRGPSLSYTSASVVGLNHITSSVRLSAEFCTQQSCCQIIE